MQPDRTPRRPRGSHQTRTDALLGLCTVVALTLGACAAPSPEITRSTFANWDDVVTAAQNQTVRLWMYGGDTQGNAYIDAVLTPAVAAEGVTLERMPVTDTRDAPHRVLSELQAGHARGRAEMDRSQPGAVHLPGPARLHRLGLHP